MQTEAAVLYEYGDPLRVRQIDLDEPREHEILVKISAASVCATDLHASQGFFSLPLPLVLGHEGSGIVQEIGGSVTKVLPGDHVVLSAIVPCGKCKMCLLGKPWACEEDAAAKSRGTMPVGGYRLKENGRAINHFFAQSAFSTHAVVPEAIAVRVSKDIPLELLAPLGCGVQTGSGATINTVEPRSSVAVFGCGTVGLSSIIGARVIGASKIIAVDVIKERLDLARQLGATHVIDARNQDPIDEVRKIEKSGVDYAVEAVGKPETTKQAIASTRRFGTTIVVGAPPDNTKIELDYYSDLFDKNIRGCNEGYANSDVFIPYLLELYRQGRFPFDKLFTSKAYSLNEINDALGDLASGRVLKPIIIF